MLDRTRSIFSEVRELFLSTHWAKGTFHSQRGYDDGAPKHVYCAIGGLRMKAGFDAADGVFYQVDDNVDDARADAYVEAVIAFVQAIEAVTAHDAALFTNAERTHNFDDLYGGIPMLERGDRFQDARESTFIHERCVEALDGWDYSVDDRASEVIGSGWFSDLEDCVISYNDNERTSLDGILAAIDKALSTPEPTAA